MANLPETPQWADGIYQIETVDRVLGGPGGTANRQAKELADRTAFIAGPSGASKVGFTQAGAGAVARTAESKMREFVSVKDFGAVGDGVADDTAAIQAAINAAGASKTLVFNEGIYLCGELTIPSGIRWRGYGATLLCIASATAVNNWINPAGTLQSGHVEGLTFNYQSNTNGRHIINFGDNPRNWTVLNCTFKGMRTRQALRCAFVSTDADNGFITVKGCNFTNGNSAGAVAFYASGGVTGVRNITVEDCNITECGSSLIAITQADTPRTAACFVNTTVKNTRMVGNGTGVYGTIPIELWGHTNARVEGCSIDQATRGVGFSTSVNVAVIGNTISNQTIYAAEIGDTDDFVFSGNTMRNCGVMIAGGVGGGNNWTVTGNTFDGTGRSSLVLNTYAISFGAPSAGQSRNGFLIANNLFKNLTYISGALRLNNCTSVNVQGNTQIASTEFDSVQFANIDRNVGASYSKNLVLLRANYTENTPGFDSQPGVFSPVPSAPQDYVTIDGNTIISMATSLAGAGVCGIGISAGASDYKNLTIQNNIFIGYFGAYININDNGRLAVIRNNDFTRATEKFTSDFTASLQKRRNDYDAAGAAPTTGTWQRGDYVRNRNIATGQPKGWYCTVAGTGGTLSGVTGDITSGTSTLMVNSAADLRLGQYITIAGISGTKRILSISGTTVTISSAANATVTGAAVAFSVPTFVSEGNL